MEDDGDDEDSDAMEGVIPTHEYMNAHDDTMDWVSNPDALPFVLYLTFVTL